MLSAFSEPALLHLLPVVGCRLPDPVRETKIPESMRNCPCRHLFPLNGNYQFLSKRGQYSQATIHQVKCSFLYRIVSFSTFCNRVCKLILAWKKFDLKIILNVSSRNILLKILARKCQVRFRNFSVFVFFFFFFTF